jgi:hypothetical protein
MNHMRGFLQSIFRQSRPVHTPDGAGGNLSSLKILRPPSPPGPPGDAMNCVDVGAVVKQEAEPHATGRPGLRCDPR